MSYGMLQQYRILKCFSNFGQIPSYTPQPLPPSWLRSATSSSQVKSIVFIEFGEYESQRVWARECEVPESMGGQSVWGARGYGVPDKMKLKQLLQNRRQIQIQCKSLTQV